ncbi:hypothetical protein C8F04DRAFT_1260067 [Mycena alexandri]|uniref:Uncharacterized protein n=1 Tax=Mycena alexandri TaxID=1745969 RepID=A0AAD6SV23_9AGAR|nr:hypothetical protein C8F04DRAFT_1260067 [Mycena alexandri]
MATTNFYCKPKYHNDPVWDNMQPTGLWLVTSKDALEPGAGIYSSWDSCAAVCEGISGAGATFYKTEDECVAAWHAHCRLGKHNHPAEPQTPTRARAQRSSTTSILLDSLHFAVRGGEVIYSNLDAAFAHYRECIEDGRVAELLATRHYMKAIYFAQGANEWTAEKLLEEGTDELATSSLVSPSPHPKGGVVYPVTPSGIYPLSPTHAVGATPSSLYPLSPTHAVSEQKKKKDAARAARLAAIETALATNANPAPYASTSRTPKTVFRAPKKPIVIGGRVAEKAPTDGNESDALYSALDDAEIFEDWVAPEDRFNPAKENGPSDDA